MDRDRPLTPEEVIQLSIKFGIDMTPNQDLEQRLQQFEEQSTTLLTFLDRLQISVDKYKRSVDGLEDEGDNDGE